MPLKSRLAPIKLLFACLLAILALAPAALSARDQIEYGKYLGMRLRLYQEAYEVLDKEISAAKDNAGKSRARQAKAEVMKTEADHIYAEDGNMDARMKRYRAALGVFSDVTEPAGVLAKAVMQLDVAHELRRLDPVQARSYCDEAASALDAVRLSLEKERDKDGKAFEVRAEVYNSIFFNMCRSYYVKSLTFDVGSSDREHQLKLSEKWIDEFDFLREGTTREFVLTYKLRAEIALARGDAEAAASKFMELVNFVGAFPASSVVGGLALEHGYLPAVELLTTELEYDTRNLQKAIDLYAEAFSKYGNFSELDFWFKRFQLYRISALIKLGNQSQIQGAVALLFKLATDRDANFRRSALTVLADVATRPELDDETRFKCAETVFSEMTTNHINVNLKNIQAYQSLLASCGDVKKFETFGPACFTRIADSYSNMWRFYDAALVYREGAYRTLYFKDKFADADAVPEHMKGRCDLIKDAESLTKFPGEMANRGARHAGYLIQKEIGDPNNKELKAFADSMDKLKAEISEGDALLDLQFKKAREYFGAKKWANAAVLFLKLPARYRSYHMSLYIAGKAYYTLSEDFNAPRMNRSGPEEERESEAFFTDQRNRHALDLKELPESMWKGMETEHWDVIQNGATKDSLANWHKAVYLYKKYFLFEALRHWKDIQPLLEGNDKPTIVDGMQAVAQFRNAAWMQANPSGKGDPDADMKRMGYAAYDLAYLLRNPPKNLPPADRDTASAAGRDLALGILRPFWTMFGLHLADNTAYQKGSLSLAFGALWEARDGDACEQLYLTYAEAFPDDKAKIEEMVNKVYGILVDQLQPLTSAMARASSRIGSRAAQLKKDQFKRVNERDYPDDAKRVADAKTAYERQKALADHFWKVWIKQKTFDPSEDNPISAHLPEALPAIEKRWNEMSETYPKRWAEAVRAEFDKQIKLDIYKDIKAAADKAASGDNLALLDRLQTARDAEKEDANKQRFVQLITTIELNTGELGFFTGTVFIYEFGAMLEAMAADIDERARPVTTRILKYYELSRIGAGGNIEKIQLEEMSWVAGQYIRIRDWKNAVRYFEVIAEKTKVQWGKEEEIPVDAKLKTIGRPANAGELEVRNQLGKAYLELYRTTGDIEQLKKAALHLRRCLCFNEIRDTNKKMGDPFKLSFQQEIETYYLATSENLAQVFLELFRLGDIKIEWPKYVDQVTSNFAPKKDDKGNIVLQGVPADKAGFLWFASQIRLQVWASFTKLSAYQYRGEFRTNLIGWLEAMIRWIDAYGQKPPAGVTEAEIQQRIQDAYLTASNESNFTAAYLAEDTRQYIAKLQELLKRIVASCEKAKITLKK